MLLKMLKVALFSASFLFETFRWPIWNSIGYENELDLIKGTQIRDHVRRLAKINEIQIMNAIPGELIA